VIDGNVIVADDSHALTQGLLTGGGLDHVQILGNTFGGSASQLVYVNGALNVGNASTHVDFTNNTFSGTAVDDGALVVLDADHSTLSGNVFSGAGGAALVLQQAGNTVASSNNFGGFGSGTDIVTADTSFDLNTLASAQNLAAEFAAAGVHFTGNALDNDISGNVTFIPSFSDNFNDTLEGRGGNDTLHGLGGVDTAVYAGTITVSNIATVADIDPNTAGNQKGWQVNASASGEGTDILDDIEIIDNAGHNILLVGNGGFTSIQDAVNAASDGDTILIANGTYTLGATLNVDRDVTLQGESEAGVIIDASGLDGYGIFLTGNGATLANFTLHGPHTGSPSGNYGIKAQPFPATGSTDALTGITIEHVTVSGSLISEIDFNGVDNSTLRNVTADGLNTDGVGIALTDSTGITLENITTSNNNWGSVALYTTGTFFAPGTGNITFLGSYTHNEPVGIFSQDESAVADLGAVTFPPSFTNDGDGVYKVTNDSFRGALHDSATFTFFFANKADAVAFALALPSHNRSVVEAPNGNLLVENGMSIQAAVDAASDGDTVLVGAGHYQEQVTVDGLDITIKGAGQNATFIDSPNAASLVANVHDSGSGRPDKYALLGAKDDAHVTVSGLTIDGRDMGTIPQDADGLYDFVGIEALNAAISADHVTVTGVRQLDGGFPSGVQHNSAIIIRNADGTDRSFTLSQSIVENFQKNGLVLFGDHLTVDVNHNTVTGAGSIPTTATMFTPAENQIGRTLGAAIRISDNAMFKTLSDTPKTCRSALTSPLPRPASIDRWPASLSCRSIQPTRSPCAMSRINR
jgi:hypothetical protein